MRDQEGAFMKEPKNSSDEWVKCYTYFKFQVQAQRKETWAPHGAQKTWKFSPEWADNHTQEGPQFMSIVAACMPKKGLY